MGRFLNPDNSAFQIMFRHLLWNKDANTALKQIRDKKYPESLLHYTGKILLIGINYDKNNKTHQCVIEKYLKIDLVD